MNSRSSGPRKRPSTSVGATGPSEPVRPCLVVGIGASAGGLRAVSRLLERLPADTGMAYVLVEHLDPLRPSHLADLLSNKSAMAVAEATDGVHVEPDHVYIIPPGKDMTVAGGQLRLTTRTDAAGRHLPIDSFMHSLAADLRERCIGVILSGSASDGRLGLTAIKSGGGLTFAQDPASAEFPSMPASAIAAGVVDFVLPPEEIAAELVRIATHPYLADCIGAPDETAPAVAVPAFEGGALEEIFSLLRVAFGVDFSGYKMTTVRRRIARRMLLRRSADLEEYVGALRQDPEEVEALYHDILIMVTEFFREPGAFAVLREEVFPSILQAADGDTPVRLWVPGCATGEEAYSLAITLLDVMSQMSVTRPVKLLATDINERDLQVARRGLYAESIASAVAPELLQRFFVRSAGGYQINKRVRGLCVFARHDVTRDPPFANLDLVSCRNLLIYLTADLQRRVIPVLHYALKPGGYLVLGRSESVGRLSGLFDVIDGKQKIFAKKLGSAGAGGFGMPAGWLHAETRTPAAASAEPPFTVRGGNVRLREEADKVVLAAFGPAGVTVDSQLAVVDVRGRTDPYLRIRPGAPSLNLLDMVHDDLAGKLRSALAEAERTGEKVVVRAANVGGAGDPRSVDLHVLPFSESPGGMHYVILFDELPPAAGARAARKPAKAGRGPAEDTELDLLREELDTTRERLEALISDKEAANEELRAASEENLAAAEEMQSVNEELETSQEELRSTNEELNARNSELSELSDDLGNLLTSINFPIIMVGRDLRIRRFTPVAERVCRMITGDVGRPITDLQLRIDVPDLRALLTQVIETMVMSERAVQDDQGHWYSMQVRPYRSGDNRVDGAVITLFDIDEITHRYEAQRHIALTLQRNFIHRLPEIDGLELDSFSAPANRPELVGGDFHDAFQLADGRVVLLIGDVMGKGFTAAGLTETVRASVRALALVSFSPERILGKVNRVLVHEGAHRQLVTVLLLVLDPKTGQGRLASAGHPPAVHVSESGCAFIEPRYGPPLGAFELPYKATGFTIAPGDALVLYTDGVTEARRHGELFGEERLCETLRKLGPQHPHQLVQGLQNAAISFAGELRDDMQILAARRKTS